MGSGIASRTMLLKRLWIDLLEEGLLCVVLHWEKSNIAYNSIGGEVPFSSNGVIVSFTIQAALIPNVQAY